MYTFFKRPKALVLLLALSITLITFGTASAESNPTPTPFTVADRNNGIIAGPDGNMWFFKTNENKLSRITLDGEVTDFDIPSGSYGSSPEYMASDTNQNI